MMRLKANKRNVIYSMHLCANVSITPWKMTGMEDPELTFMSLCLEYPGTLFVPRTEPCWDARYNWQSKSRWMTLHIPELIRDIMDSRNYLTVSLSNADGKVLSKILAVRLESSPKYYS